MLLVALWPTDGFSRKGILLFLGFKTILIREIHNSQSTFCFGQEIECNVNGGWAFAFLSEGKAILRWKLNTFFCTWDFRGRTNTPRKLVMPHLTQAMTLGRNCLQRTPGAPPHWCESEQKYGASKQYPKLLTHQVQRKELYVILNFYLEMVLSAKIQALTKLSLLKYGSSCSAGS